MERWGKEGKVLETLGELSALGARPPGHQIRARGFLAAQTPILLNVPASTGPPSLGHITEGHEVVGQGAGEGQ